MTGWRDGCFAGHAGDLAMSANRQCWRTGRVGELTVLANFEISNSSIQFAFAAFAVMAYRSEAVKIASTAGSDLQNSDRQKRGDSAKSDSKSGGGQHYDR